jgi:hypothetical protein
MVLPSRTSPLESRHGTNTTRLFCSWDVRMCGWRFAERQKKELAYRRRGERSGFIIQMNDQGVDEVVKPNDENADRIPES